jgi:hypothetical protein
LVAQAQLFGLAYRASQLVSLNDGTEVEQCSRDGGDRDSLVRGDLVLRQIRPMKPHAGARLAPSRDRDLDPVSPSNAPQRRRRPVAQHRAVSAREHGSQPTPVPSKAMAGDGVDAAMDPPEPPDFDSMVNRTRSKS